MIAPEGVRLDFSPSTDHARFSVLSNQKRQANQQRPRLRGLVRVAPAVGLENTAEVSNGRETARNDASGCEVESVGDGSRHWWTESGTISDAARAYLEAGAAGLPCAELAVELAQAVLGHPDVQLALRVLEGGPFAHARATELASRVLESENAEALLGKSRGDGCG